MVCKRVRDDTHSTESSFRSARVTGVLGPEADEGGSPPALVQVRRVGVGTDNPDGRASIVRILEGQGARPIGAASATEASKLLAAGCFHMSLSDSGMPEMDGYRFIRKVRELDVQRSAPLPAIAVTAYARSENRQRSPT